MGFQTMWCLLKEFMIDLEPWKLVVNQLILTQKSKTMQFLNKTDSRNFRTSWRKCGSSQSLSRPCAGVRY